VNIKNTFFIVLACLFSLGSCQSQKKEPITAQKQHEEIINSEIIVGANQLEKYLPLLTSKRIGVVANQTSVIFKNSVKPENQYTHIVDSLVSLDINIQKVFAPEHGFRGKADAGEHITNGEDPKTGIDIISIYGKNKKPSIKQLINLDIVVFDIQDVGARFYTYISSLHYVMEACAENNIPVLILDRPNPNGHYTDGPILELEHKSFVGMHPIPVVHGMTIGEYAQMINGEKWLNNGIQCAITIIKCENYTKQTEYSLPIKPSPNLPNDVSINLYPSLCFFEGTTVSVGRGTDMQFQIYGAPFLPKTNFNFIPKPNEGAKYPKHVNKICYGEDLRNKTKLDVLNLEWLSNTYNLSSDKETFFNNFFTKLAGTKKLQQQIINGANVKEIRQSWVKGLQEYNQMKKQYLLY
jgi:uncharacterized protein YbbC (DUF1343 family)